MIMKGEVSGRTKRKGAAREYLEGKKTGKML
jgi:hypothetical protein